MRWKREFNSDIPWVERACANYFREWLIDSAEYEDRWIDWRGKPVFVKRGQVIFSARELVRTWGITRQRLRTLLRQLSEIKFISIDTQNSQPRQGQNLTRPSNPPFTLVTILKYDIYNPNIPTANPAFQPGQGQNLTHPPLSTFIARIYKNTPYSPPKGDPPSPPSGEEKTPPEKPKAKRKTKKPVTDWPEGFALRNGMREYAIKQGVDPSKVDALFESFHNSALAKGRQYADWRRAWYTFCQNAKEFSKWAMAQSADVKPWKKKYANIGREIKT